MLRGRHAVAADLEDRRKRANTWPGQKEEEQARVIAAAISGIHTYATHRFVKSPWRALCP